MRTVKSGSTFIWAARERSSEESNTDSGIWCPTRRSPSKPSSCSAPELQYVTRPRRSVLTSAVGVGRAHQVGEQPAVRDLGGHVDPGQDDVGASTVVVGQVGAGPHDAVGVAGPEVDGALEGLRKPVTPRIRQGPFEHLSLGGRHDLPQPQADDRGPG